LDLADNQMGKISMYSAGDMSGVIILADAIKDMGAMTSLNLSSNRMGKLVAQTANHQVSC
jgi:hypothetical protein